MIKNSEEKKILTVRVNAEDLKAIDEKAKGMGLTRASFCRYLILQGVRGVEVVGNR